MDTDRCHRGFRSGDCIESSLPCVSASEHPGNDDYSRLSYSRRGARKDDGVGFARDCACDVGLQHFVSLMSHE